MPVSPEDSVKKEVLYPDDLPGMELEIRENAYYDAEQDEDAKHLPEKAQYGLFLPVKDVAGDDLWASAPRGLREALLEAGLGSGDSFIVTDLQKGSAEHDPYQATVEER